MCLFHLSITVALICCVQLIWIFAHRITLHGTNTYVCIHSIYLYIYRYIEGKMFQSAYKDLLLHLLPVHLYLIVCFVFGRKKFVYDSTYWADNKSRKNLKYKTLWALLPLSLFLSVLGAKWKKCVLDAIVYVHICKEIKQNLMKSELNSMAPLWDNNKLCTLHPFAFVHFLSNRFVKILIEHCYSELSPKTISRFGLTKDWLSFSNFPRLRFVSLFICTRVVHV